MTFCFCCCQRRGNWKCSRCVDFLFCDEKKNTALQNNILNGAKERIGAFLIGPEGGFSDNERLNMIKLGNVRPVSLGSRILRADTAAIVAATIVQITNNKVVI